MTVKEYREYETKINEEINKLKDKLVKAEKQVNFGIPFGVLMEELQKHMFVKNKHNVFCAMIEPTTLSIFKDNIICAVNAEIRESLNNSVFAYIECRDNRNRAHCSFCVDFDMDTKLSDGTLLVDTLKIEQHWSGSKRVTMDEKDVQKVIVDMSPSGKNYNEIPLEGFVDTLVEIMESKDKAQEYVEQIKAGKRKNPAIEPGAFPPSEGARAEYGVIDVRVKEQSKPIVEACNAQSSDMVVEEDYNKKPIVQTDESLEKKKKIQRIAEIIEGVKQKKIASGQNYEIGGHLVAAVSKSEVIKMVREKKIANGEKVRPDYPANEKEMAEVIAYSLQFIDEIKNKSSGSVM